jgi:hypothetical protein
MIFSTRNWMRWTSGVAISIAAAGCMNGPVTTVTTTGSIARQPQADEATEFRASRQSVALYQSGATQGYPTRWYYAPNPANSTPENFVGDSVMFIAQTASLPVTLVTDYPFRKIVYAGDVLPPSSTAMPPLPPEGLQTAPVPSPDPLVAPREPLLPLLPPIPDERPPLILPPEKKPAKVKSTSAVSSKPSAVAPTTRPTR